VKGRSPPCQDSQQSGERFFRGGGQTGKSGDRPLRVLEVYSLYGGSPDPIVQSHRGPHGLFGRGHEGPEGGREVGGGGNGGVAGGGAENDAGDGVDYGFVAASGGGHEYGHGHGRGGGGRNDLLGHQLVGVMNNGMNIGSTLGLCHGRDHVW
jgi:hypothetical protein